MELVTKVETNINSVKVHPQLSDNGHPVDGALVGVGSHWRLGQAKVPVHPGPFQGHIQTRMGPPASM
jgi:hypothetical protein